MSQGFPLVALKFQNLPDDFSRVAPSIRLKIPVMESSRLTGAWAMPSEFAPLLPYRVICKLRGIDEGMRGTYHISSNPPRRNRECNQPILSMFIIKHFNQEVNSRLGRTISRRRHGDVSADGCSSGGNDDEDGGFCGWGKEEFVGGLE